MSITLDTGPSLELCWDTKKKPDGLIGVLDTFYFRYDDEPIGTVYDVLAALIDERLRAYDKTMVKLNDESDETR